MRLFADKIASIKILDPACGSGNFLYIALRLLLDLQNDVINFSDEMGTGRFFISVTPAQLYGIEINEYAYELAQMTIQIGYIQWLRENGYGFPEEPILRQVKNIRHMDAVLAYDENGMPVEPEWPEVDVIVGNPPFLGDKKMRAELGHKYVEDLRTLYGDRIPGQSDLVCYWFEKARAMIERGWAKRAGLLATNSIRGGANRRVLDRIKETGNIFWAQSDRDWILDGAAVNVSMVGFDNGQEEGRSLDEHKVLAINSDLSSIADITKAKQLAENAGFAFVGDTKKGQFDIGHDLAKEMLKDNANPNGLPNSDVIKPWINGLDITDRPRNMWIIDFGNDMPEHLAAQYEKPFEYVRQYVKPARNLVRNEREKKYWWLHGRTAPDLRLAINGLDRFLATARVAKYRLFTFIPANTIPDAQVVVFAADDEYFLGVLHSRCHEIWSLKLGTSLEDRPRYSLSLTFATFPFPWPPGKEPKDDPRVQIIAQAAKELVEQRNRWLNAEGLSEAEKKK